MGILDKLGASNRHRGSLGNGRTGNYDASHDEFLRAIYGDLAGTSYQSLIDANPFSNQPYTPTFWDKLGNFFNFNTAEDKLFYQNQSDSRNWIAQVMSTKFENDYNSSTAMAQRMRAAGQNPDLLGTTGVSPAAEFTEPESRDMSSIVGSDQAKFQQLAGTIFDIVNAGFGFAEKFASVSQMMQNIEFGRDNQARSIAQMIAPSLYSEINKTPGRSIEGVSDDEIAAVLNSNFPSFNLYRKGSKRRGDMISRIRSYTNTLNSGMEGAATYYENMNRATKGKFESADAQSKYGFKLDEPTETVIGILDIMNEGYKDLVKSQRSAAKGEADYKTEFYDEASGQKAAERQNSDNQEQIDYNKSFDSGTAGEAQNATNEQVKASKSTEATLDKMTNEIFNYLKRKADDGGKFATGCLTAFAMFRFLSMSNLTPSVNIGSGPKGNSFGIGF